MLHATDQLRHKVLLFTRSEAKQTVQSLFIFQRSPKEKWAKRACTRGEDGRKAKWAKRKWFFWGPTTTSSTVSFCAGVQFSCDFIRVFKDRINIRENRGLWEVWERRWDKHALTRVKEGRVLVWNVSNRWSVILCLQGGTSAVSKYHLWVSVWSCHSLTRLEETSAGKLVRTA